MTVPADAELDITRPAVFVYIDGLDPRRNINASDLGRCDRTSEELLDLYAELGNVCSIGEEDEALRLASTLKPKLNGGSVLLANTVVPAFPLSSRIRQMVGSWAEGADDIETSYYLNSLLSAIDI